MTAKPAHFRETRSSGGSGWVSLERTDPADPARRGRMVVAAVMMRRTGHGGGAIADEAAGGKGRLGSQDS